MDFNAISKNESIYFALEDVNVHLSESASVPRDGDELDTVRLGARAVALHPGGYCALNNFQVVNLAVRSYFIVALMGRQYLNSNSAIVTIKTVSG